MKEPTTVIKPDTIIRGDCIEILGAVTDPLADLVFADPPFNIGYKYDVYEDVRKYDEYYAWTEKWMSACCGVLKPTGSFWIAIGDDYAAEVRLIGRKLGLTLRNWVIWYYTFGQSTKNKFARSHTHLFYFVKHPTEFTFVKNAVRTFSDRQRVYADKRANKLGKMPDDVWSTFPRLCGTFEERVTWHPCQMPESLLSRIIRVSSNPGDLVLDPFSGSGTTSVAAKRLARRYVGVELSENYVTRARQRLEGVKPLPDIDAGRLGIWPQEHIKELQAAYLEAAVPTDQLFKNRPLLSSFVQQFNWRLEHSGSCEAYEVEEVWVQLERLRKKNQLGRVKVHAAEPVRTKVRPLS